MLKKYLTVLYPEFRFEKNFPIHEKSAKRNRRELILLFFFLLLERIDN